MAFNKEDGGEGSVAAVGETDDYRNLRKRRGALTEPDYAAWYASLSTDTRNLDFAGEYMKDKMREVGNKASRLTGKPYVDPEFLFDEGLGNGVDGATYIDRKGNAEKVAANPSVANSFRRAKATANQEGVHVVQKGLHVMADVFAMVYNENTGDEYLFQIGRMIAEGDDELTLDQIGEGPTGAYPDELGLARELDAIYPNKRLFEMAEEYGDETVVDMLNYGEAKNIIGRYLTSKLGKAGRPFTSFEIVYAPATE